MTAKKTILFVGEAVTLAHVSRPLVLAQSLDPNEFDVHFACDRRYESLLKVAPHIHYWPIRSIPSGPFVKAIDHGWFDWAKKDVESYIAEDLELFEKVKPALVVGDYRLTLPISGTVGGAKVASLTNFHWSPYSLMRVAAPAFPPRPIATRIRGRIQRAFKSPLERTSTAVFNAVRERYGQAALNDFHQLVAMGDYTLYVEPPDFMPAEPLPPNHVFLGPILWSPSVAKPSWWEAWDKGRPLIYVTLGSSGAAKQLPSILQSLERFGATIVVATAGRIRLDERPNVFAADYLPGLEISALASVVVCNGGSATAYQALSQGAPVVGLWSNLDQFYTMTTLERTDAGIACSASNFSQTSFMRAVSTALEDPQYRSSAAKLADLFKSYDAQQRFRQFIHDIPETAH
jgi:UDP:flavonoid glycosyltransferase YjiC (YdhE family)